MASLNSTSIILTWMASKRGEAYMKMISHLSIPPQNSLNPSVYTLEKKSQLSIWEQKGKIMKDRTNSYKDRKLTKYLKSPVEKLNKEKRITSLWGSFPTQRISNLSSLSVSHQLSWMLRAFQHSVCSWAESSPGSCCFDSILCKWGIRSIRTYFISCWYRLGILRWPFCSKLFSITSELTSSYRSEKKSLLKFSKCPFLGSKKRRIWVENWLQGYRQISKTFRISVRAS